MAILELISGADIWMESAALRQLQSIAAYAHVSRVVGLPDLHPGRSPVGLAVVGEGHIYPYLIGGDIGCGLALFASGIPVKKCRLEQWETRLNGIESFRDLPLEHPFADESPIDDLGSIGGGNHFIEFQAVAAIHDPQTYNSLELDDDAVLILVHTGSRAFGPRILEAFGSESGYALTEAHAEEYLRLHNQALVWAQRNRALAAARILGALGFAPRLKPCIDCVHNFMERRGNAVIHRKGAVSTLNGPVVIPGSRGTLTYIVKPNPATEHTAFSISHGAGRKWARTECRGRIGKRYDRNSIRRTALKSRVVCRDTDLLFEEAPEAYKNITTVMQALADHGLIEVVATLRPLLTYKG